MQPLAVAVALRLEVRLAVGPPCKEEQPAETRLEEGQAVPASLAESPEAGKGLTRAVEAMRLRVGEISERAGQIRRVAPGVPLARRAERLAACLAVERLPL